MTGQSSEVEVRSSPIGNVVLGSAMLGFVAALVAMVVLWDDDSLFFARDTRQPGIIKALERAMGWELFLALLVVLGAWFLTNAVVQFWKAIDRTPDVTATPVGLEFHPAMRRAARYEEVSSWSFDRDNPRTSLLIRFRDRYWSLQGMFPRRSLTIDGGRKKLEPLANYLLEQPEMRGKFSARW